MEIYSHLTVIETPSRL